MDGDGRVLGVVSRAEVRAWRAARKAAGDRAVDIMTPLIHAIGPDRPMAEAAARMIQERVDLLLVIDEGFRPLGVLSAADVRRAAGDMKD